jgi:uncharacterized protein (DUF58 family)
MTYLEPAVLSKLLPLPLHARHAMLGSVSGKHRSPVRGSSIEFAQYRKYVPGDDTRRLDWRTWGRTDRYYVKEFEADTNLRLCVILDTSGSMNFQPGKSLSRPTPMPRMEYAKRLGCTLSYLAAHQGDAVGLWQVGAKRVEMPAKRGAVHLGLVLDALRDLKATGNTHLVESLHDAAERISQRALVVIISDLFCPPEELKPALQHLRFKKHDVSVFHLLDQQEIDFDFDRPARFVDLEGNEPVLADPSDIAVRYREAFKQYLAQVDELVSSTGIDYHRVKLHEPYDEVLARFLLSRTPKKGR